MIEPVSLTLREIELKLTEPFRISSGVTHARRVLLVELTDDAGSIGWGECVAGETPHYSPETIETCRLAIRTWIAPLVLGQPIARAADVHGRLERSIRGHRMAKATVEMAAWALEAERGGISLASLLGGTRDRIEVGISLGLQDTPDELARKARAAVSEGYRRIKCKIGPSRDVEYVAAVRDAVGPGVALSVDANAAYESSDADHLARLDAFGLAMIEQPLDSDDLLRHAELQRRLMTPICLDESITGAARAEDAIALGSARILNVKPGRVGGHTSAKAVHDLAAARSIPVWCGGMLESGIGRAHNVALASLPNFRLPGDLSPSARYWTRDVVTPAWSMSRDGHVTVPRDRPGLGVAVDRGYIEHLTVRLEQLAR